MRMVVPGLGPVALPIPIAHSDDPPPPELQELLEYEPATEWNEHWALVDVEAAQHVAGSFIESFNVLRRFPSFHW